MAFLVYDPATNPLNNNEWAFPLLECIHILGFAVAIGTIVMVDLRLFGVAFQRLPVRDLAKSMAPWTLLGLAAVLTSGPLIFTSDPNMYLLNQGFRFKMGCLLVALLYNYTIRRSVALSAPLPGTAKLVAAGSVAAWLSVVFGGIFIAFV